MANSKNPEKKKISKTVKKKKVPKELSAQFLSFTAFAKEVNTTRDKLRTAVENKIFSDESVVITETASGKRYSFNIELAKEEWTKYIPKRKITKPALAGIDDLDKDDNLNDADSEESIDMLAGNFDVYRSFDMKYKAKKSKLEYESMAGKYVEVDDVRKTAMKIGKAVKDAFTKLPGKVVSKIIGKEDVHEVEQILQHEVNKTLQQIDWRYVQKVDSFKDEEIK